MKFTLLSRSVTAAAMLAAAIVPTAWAGPRQAAKSASTLTINVGQLVPTLDPASACHLVDTGVTNLMYAQLTQYGTKRGPGGTLEQNPARMRPYLAKSWTKSRNGLTYTFHLRRGLKFPSGDPVNSAAVKYSFNRTIKINGCGSYGIVDGLYKPPQFKAIATPNPTTVVFHLGQPNSDFLQNLAQWSAVVDDPKLIQAHGGVKANTPNQWMASHDAGYGPYLLKSYHANKQAIFVANPRFFFHPSVHRIIVNFFSSDTPLLLAARSGQADVTEVLSKQAAHSLVGNHCCRVLAFPIAAWDKLIIPNNVAPFNNVKFREALTYAVPYKQILQRVYYGYGQSFYGIWSPAQPWFNPKIGKPRTFNLAKAQSLIRQSHVKTPISFDLLTPEGNTIEGQIATIIQGIWSQLGITANVKTVTVAEQLQDAYTTHKHAVLFYDGPGVISPMYQWDYDGKCGSQFNSDLSCIPAADRMIAPLRKTASLKKWRPVADKVDKMWIAQSPRIPIMQDKFVVVLSRRVTHFEFYGSAQFSKIRIK
jgi:peptide/nickel transport system substrate-binding protein